MTKQVSEQNTTAAIPLSLPVTRRLYLNDQEMFEEEGPLQASHNMLETLKA